VVSALIEAMAILTWLCLVTLGLCPCVTRGDQPPHLRAFDLGGDAGPLQPALIQKLFDSDPFFADFDDQLGQGQHRGDPPQRLRPFDLGGEMQKFFDEGPFFADFNDRPARPLLVHAGPAADVVFGDLMPDALLQDLARSASFDLEDLQPLMLARGGLAGPRSQGSPFRLRRPQFSLESQERFQVTQDEGHFRLRGDVPGYNFSTADSNSQEAKANPLSVTVVGQALVVSGTRKDGEVTRSFQRSWQLPRNARVDGISVSFNPSNHTLTVDVPTEASSAEAGSETFEENRDGSGSTVMFSSMASPMSMGSPSEEDIFDKMFPMVVHRKDSQPYWRLSGGENADGKSMLEVVLPKGMVAGHPHDRQLPVHRLTDSGTEASGETEAAEPEASIHVDLPVEVQAETCQSATGLLRCPIDAAQVRKMPISTEL